MKALCIHGHFYQPHREDPISDFIPDESGAEPYHNWNERILDECYRPNAQLGNFGKISFNIGPTLFKWIEKVDSQTAGFIVSQENENYALHGVGNAMAQAYNHVILPLANKRDKTTQIRWGIADFEHRFGHKPSGMWLPETAVDMETLCTLSDCGIEFTLLAPWQADGEELDTQKPYLVELPGERDPFPIFFYDRDLSTRVSFHPESTVNGDAFLASILEQDNKSSGLTIIASDGELYGHHQPFRDRFLTYIVNEGAYRYNIELTYPGLWLRHNQVTDIVSLNEFTSWSCQHGVLRWMGECACTPGAVWKAPMRWGLERLAEDIDGVYQQFISQFMKKPWELRDAYIKVMLGEVPLDQLLSEFVTIPLDRNTIYEIGQLLDAQYERQRMFTSCGWYFDDFHRIEPQNNIAYAAKAVWLTKQVTGVNLESRALALLRKVRSQKTGLRGDTVFSQTWIRAQDLQEEMAN